MYAIGHLVESACVTSKKWCSSGGAFAPPDVFRMYEGPIALEQRGYVRGVFTSDNSLHVPSHCTATNMVCIFSSFSFGLFFSFDHQLHILYSNFSQISTQNSSKLEFQLIL
jgi:hypothetical protein